MYRDSVKQNVDFQRDLKKINKEVYRERERLCFYLLKRTFLTQSSFTSNSGG